MKMEAYYKKKYQIMEALQHIRKKHQQRKEQKNIHMNLINGRQK